MLSALLGLALIFPAAPGYARSTADDTDDTAQAAEAVDTVNLKNGGMIRGTLVEVVPDVSVTILSAASGERKTFPWTEVAGIERASDTPRAPAPAPAPPPEPYAGPGAPRLHIEPTRDTRVDLFEITAEVVAHGYNTTVRGIAYRPVCTSPCGDIIDGTRGQSFFFGGDGVTTSQRFTLSGQSGDLVASVKPGRRGLRVGGLLAASFGAAGVVVGGTLFAVANIRSDRTSFDDMGNLVTTHTRPNYTPAAAILATGAAMLIGGIVMYVLGRTTYKFSQRGIGKRLRLRAG